MKRSALFAPIFGLAACSTGLIACSSGDMMTPVAAIEAPTYSLTDTSLSFTTGTFTVPTGDSFECFYTPVMSDRPWAVNGASGMQGPGGHHVVVYYSTIPQQPVGHHPCTDQEMTQWRQIAGSAGHNSTGAEGLVTLPDGLAIKVPAGHQIVMQAHYINATANPMTVNDQVTINFVPADHIKAFANYIVGDDDEFQMAPQQRLTRSYTCKTPQDVNVVLMLGHMHEFGKHFKWDLLDQNQMPVRTLYEKQWDPTFASHPPLTTFSYDKPLFLPKGTIMRQTCEWENTSNEMVAFPREMCISFAYYYPDMGELSCEKISVQ